MCSCNGESKSIVGSLHGSESGHPQSTSKRDPSERDPVLLPLERVSGPITKVILSPPLDNKAYDATTHIRIKLPNRVVCGERLNKEGRRSAGRSDSARKYSESGKLCATPRNVTFPQIRLVESFMHSQKNSPTCLFKEVPKCSDEFVVPHAASLTYASRHRRVCTSQVSITGPRFPLECCLRYCVQPNLVHFLLRFNYSLIIISCPASTMTERRSYDSVDDLERLVKHENIQLSVNGHIDRPAQLREARQRRIWLHLGWAMSLAFVFIVGYLGGAKSAASSNTTAPWVAGPLGAPYSNCR
jgi:hypothetical protein